MDTNFEPGDKVSWNGGTGEITFIERVGRRFVIYVQPDYDPEMELIFEPKDLQKKV